VFILRRTVCWVLDIRIIKQGVSILKLTIISGSQRPNSDSSRIGRYISEQEFVSKSYSTINFLDLNELNLPLWNEGFWSNDAQWDVWKEPASIIQQSDAVIVVVPEWGGMVPPILKNFFLLCGPQELGHKPCLIVSISSGRGGSNPINELRSTAYKNNHVCFIPDHLIVRDCKKMFADEDSESSQYLERRLEFSTNLLSEYAKALGSVRESGVADVDEYRYGMS